MEHPPEHVLLRFTLGATSRQENRQVVRHLLARCPACAAALRKMWTEPPADPPIPPDAYDQALDRVEEQLRKLLRPELPPPPPPRLTLLTLN